LPIFSLLDPDKQVVREVSQSATPVSQPPKPEVKPLQRSEPITPKYTSRSSFSTPSILDALKDEPTAASIDILSETNLNNMAPKQSARLFNQTELLEVWMKFVEVLEIPQLKSALTAREPIISENGHLEFELDTELQFNRFTSDVKPKLVSFLRRELQNDSIEIRFTISDGTSHQSAIPYTDEEKWNLLVSRYPDLAPLKSKFGLDFELY
jgi:hypothetical protein